MGRHDKREHRKGKPHERKAPSELTRREMHIRGEPELAITSRVLYLLVALSHFRNQAFMSMAKMAQQLKTSEWQIRNSLRTILAIAPALFRVEPGIGVHQPSRYHRVYLANETAAEFVLRAQRWPGLDICLGLHWIACSAADPKTGIARFAAGAVWNVSDKTLRRARRKMTELGYIKVEAGRGGKGKTACYVCNLPIRRKARSPEQQEAKTREATQEATREADRQKRREQNEVDAALIGLAAESEESEAERRERVERERKRRDIGFDLFGIDENGKPIKWTSPREQLAKLKKPEKRVIRIKMPGREPEPGDV